MSFALRVCRRFFLLRVLVSFLVEVADIVYLAPLFSSVVLYILGDCSSDGFYKIDVAPACGKASSLVATREFGKTTSWLDFSGGEKRLLQFDMWDFLILIFWISWFSFNLFWRLSRSHTHVPNHQLDFPVLIIIIYISLGTDDYDDEYWQSFFLPTVGTMGNEKTSGWARQSSFSSNGWLDDWNFGCSHSGTKK